MAGWDLKKGKLVEEHVSTDEYWSLFNYVFSDNCAKTNTYKFGFLKSILDSIFDGKINAEGMFLSYEHLFARFTENYWNLVVKYNLKQMRNNGHSDYSKIELILKSEADQNPILRTVEFESINDDLKQKIIKEVTRACKRFVIGALYSDFQGKLYSFNLKDKGLTVSKYAVEFMMKYKVEIERLNYYSWAKFLEKINNASVLTGLIDKIELATPRRNNFSIYRQILSKEFEENTCFYCGRKLAPSSHVDHFIPWSFVKDDKLWNFVLACPQCNEKKSNHLPDYQLINIIDQRNHRIESSIFMIQDPIEREVIINDFSNYNDSLISKLWEYARIGGYIPAIDSIMH